MICAQSSYHPEIYHNSPSIISNSIGCVRITWYCDALEQRLLQWKSNKASYMYLRLEGPCIIFCNMYTFQRDTQCSCTDCLLILRCQLYMFRTVTVHLQELLCRYCMCRLWYVVIRVLFDTSSWYNVWGTLYQLDVSARTIVCTYSIYKEAPKDGPLRSETCTADTWILINT